MKTPEQHAHYCVGRADLPPGRQAAMFIHAAGESSPGNLPRGTYAIALLAQDEQHLKRVSQDLLRQGFPHRIVVESDPPYTGQWMALGFPPQPRSRIKRALSNLPLAR